MMGPVAAVRTCFGKYATFSGRALRPEFWWFKLFLVIGGAGASAVDVALLGQDVTGAAGSAAGPGTGAVILSAESGAVGGLFGLVTFLPALAVTWRRLHDVGRSGAWALSPAAGALLGILLSSMLFVGVGPSPWLGLLPGACAVLPALVLLIWLIGPGTPGPNRFGTYPGAAA